MYYLGYSFNVGGYVIMFIINVLFTVYGMNVAKHMPIIFSYTV